MGNAFLVSLLSELLAVLSFAFSGIDAIVAVAATMGFAGDFLTALVCALSAVDAVCAVLTKLVCNVDEKDFVRLDGAKAVVAFCCLRAAAAFSRIWAVKSLRFVSLSPEATADAALLSEEMVEAISIEGVVCFVVYPGLETGLL